MKKAKIFILFLVIVLTLAVMGEYNHRFNEKAENVKLVNAQLKMRIDENKAKLEALEMALNEVRLVEAQQKLVMSESGFGVYIENAEMLDQILFEKGR